MAEKRSRGPYKLRLAADEPKCHASRSTVHRMKKRAMLQERKREDLRGVDEFPPNKQGRRATEEGTLDPDDLVMADESLPWPQEYSQEIEDNRRSGNAVSDDDPRIENAEDSERFQARLSDFPDDNPLESSEDERFQAESDMSQDNPLFGTMSSDSEVDDSDNQFSDSQFNAYGRPLYNGALLTVGASCFLVSRFALKHKITNSALNDLLKIIEMHCPRPNACCKSVHFLKKYHNSNGVVCETDIACTTREYCTNCSAQILDSKSPCCVKCRACFQGISSKSEFIVMNIEDQLRTLFKLSEFTSAILSNKRSSPRSTINDIVDGKCYSSIFHAGVSSDVCNLTTLWNTDGVPIFKSSGYSIWPIFLMINELPFHLRRKPEYMLVAGLWSGSKKPPMDIFLQPLVTSMKHLNENGLGLSISTPTGKFKCSIFVIAGALDLVAKAPVLNMTQFNGLYGCPKCLQRGVGCTVSTSSGGHVHVYPFNHKKPDGPLRSAKSHKQYCSDALSTAQTVYGVKGPSCIMELPHFDIIQGMAVDYMHQAILGVGRQLMKLWFLSKYHNRPWYLGRNIREVDTLLLAIHPTLEMDRLPRSIADTMKFWKAHEVRVWILYYSLPILKEHLPLIYYQHHVALVCGLYCLSKDTIDEADLSEAKSCFEYYCSVFSDLYGVDQMTINVHSLLHLVENVRNLGPLWCHSCFAFENVNGILKSLFHGSQHVNKQIVSTLVMMKKLPIMSEFLTPSDASSFDRYSLHRYNVVVSDSVCLLQKPFLPNFNENEHGLVTSYFESLDGISEYPKCKFDNRIIKSLKFSSKTRRNDSCVAFSNGSSIAFGLVIRILRQSRCALLIAPFDIKEPEHQLPQSTCGSSTKHIVSVSRHSERPLAVVPIENVRRKCLYIELKSSIFVCSFANRVEES